jgi:hypothetical protein
MVKTMTNQRKKLFKKLTAERKLLRGIKQGVGAVTKDPFPKVKKNTKRTPVRRVQRSVHTRGALNAMSPCHLPLPRAVGGYSVIRTTKIISNGEPALLFGTFKGPRSEFTETTWLDLCAVCNATGQVDQPISAADSSWFYAMDALGPDSLAGARMVPAAITIQIMNPNPLQTTSGIVYVGRSKTVLDLMGDTRTWSKLMNELVSYSAPRLCSAGKLALRGVQVNAIPNNMSVLSDFVPRGLADVTVPKHWIEAHYPADFEGFGPIFVYNPNSVPLQYIVTIEWRMRFDPLNPAYAGHTTYPPASESLWSSVISGAEAAGHGVEDIAEVVADAGVAAAGTAAAGVLFG